MLQKPKQERNAILQISKIVHVVQKNADNFSHFLFRRKFAENVHFYLVTGDSSCSAGTWVVSQEKIAKGVMLTTPNNLATRLRISRVMSLLPLYTFMAWTGTS